MKNKTKYLIICMKCGNHRHFYRTLYGSANYEAEQFITIKNTRNEKIIRSEKTDKPEIHSGGIPRKRG